MFIYLVKKKKKNLTQSSSLGHQNVSVNLVMMDLRVFEDDEDTNGYHRMV